MSYDDVMRSFGERDRRAAETTLFQLQQQEEERRHAEVIARLDRLILLGEILLKGARLPLPGAKDY